MAEVETPEVEQEVEDAIGALKEDEGDETSHDITEPEPEKKPEVTVEGLAQEIGWKPQDDFQGHEDDYVGPDEYIRRSKDIQTSMRQHLKENKKKLSSVERTLGDIKTHYEANTKATAARHKKQITELRQQRIEAIEEADPDKVDAIESEMAEVYNITPREDERPPELDPEEVEAFDVWKDANRWYEGKGAENKEMTRYANDLANDLADLPEHRALPYIRKLNILTKKVKEMYPEAFPKTARQVVNPVEAPSQGSNKRKYSARDLNPEQRQVMRDMVATEVMTEKQYIDDLVTQGELR